MKANELRIGNWYDHNGTYRQATWDTIHEVWEAQRSWCKPILLTEEILLKCGFEKGKDNWFSINYITDFDYYVEQMSISMNLQSKRLALIDSTEHESVEETTYPFYTKKGIYYLHQLQNLYHALTDEELTVNL